MFSQFSNWVLENYVMLVSFGFAASELLALIPFVRSNSLVQLFVNIFRALRGVEIPEKKEIK